jgi:hypothetical protein
VEAGIGPVGQGRYSGSRIVIGPAGFMQAPKSEIEPDDCIVVASGTGVWSRAEFDAFFGRLFDPVAPTPPTPAQIAARAARDERDAWNAAVDERRRAKQIAKKGYAK